MASSSSLSNAGNLDEGLSGLQTISEYGKPQAENASIDQDLKYAPRIALSPAVQPCLFLDKVPLEIRNQIYGNLLTTPLLSLPGMTNRSYSPKPLPTSIGQPDTVLRQLGLAPAILRANRQISEEALKVLYGMNIFRVECIWRKHHPVSALTRYVDKRVECHHPFDSRFIPNLHLIKQWKVLISSYAWVNEETPSPDFVAFCRAICKSHPTSLTAMLIPRGLEKQDPNTFLYEPELDRYHDLKQVTKPLLLLRGVGNFQFIECQTNELPPAQDPRDILHQPGTPPPVRGKLAKSRPTLKALELSLKKQVEGNSLVEHVFEMNRALVEYSQCYERYEPYREGMKMTYGRAKARIEHRKHHGPTSDMHPSFNPFQCPPYYHPVEAGLEDASYASDRNFPKTFRDHRAIVLSKLEPQYYRILNASIALNLFIKAHKVVGGFLEAGEPHNCMSGCCMAERADALTEGIVLVEDYAQAFDRDLPWMVRQQVRKIQHRWNLQYGMLHREQMLQQIRRLYEKMLSVSTSAADIKEFISLFKSLVDDLDQSYITMRRARAMLFAADKNDPGYKFEVEELTSDEVVTWSVNEPQITVSSQPSEGGEGDENNGPPHPGTYGIGPLPQGFQGSSSNGGGGAGGDYATFMTSLMQSMPPPPPSLLTGAGGATGTFVSSIPGWGNVVGGFMASMGSMPAMLPVANPAVGTTSTAQQQTSTTSTAFVTMGNPANANTTTNPLSVPTSSVSNAPGITATTTSSTNHSADLSSSWETESSSSSTNEDAGNEEEEEEHNEDEDETNFTHTFTDQDLFKGGGALPSADEVSPTSSGDDDGLDWGTEDEDVSESCPSEEEDY